MLGLTRPRLTDAGVHIQTGEEVGIKLVRCCPSAATTERRMPRGA
jgi:hypothetical protein